MLYKALNEDGSCHNGGRGKWPLPTQNPDGSWTPGEWMPAIEGELVLCANGYHGCTDEQVFKWLGPAVYEMEGRGDHLDGEDKSVYREARLLRRLNWDHAVSVAWVCDCAERVLPVFEARFPNDQRPRHAIEAARSGEKAAAHAAAHAAADAAYAAAHAAERRWQYERLAWYLEQK